MIDGHSLISIGEAQAMRRVERDERIPKSDYVDRFQHWTVCSSSLHLMSKRLPRVTSSGVADGHFLVNDPDVISVDVRGRQ